MRTKPPALQWGPFAIGSFMTLICAALVGVSIWGALAASLWLLVVTGVLVVFTAMCAASSIGVLMAPRRLASRQERETYRVQHGSLD